MLWRSRSLSLQLFMKKGERFIVYGECDRRKISLSVLRYYTHCHHCLSKCYNLIPCPNCPIAQYCSNRCLKQAWSLAHQLECKITSLLPSLLNVDKDKIRMLTKIMRLLIVVTQNGSLINELRKDMKVAESNSGIHIDFHPLHKLH